MIQLKCLIDNCSDFLGNTIKSIELFERDSVDYEADIGRKVYIIQDNSHIKYLLKVYLNDISFLEEVYHLFENSTENNQTILPIKRDGNFCFRSNQWMCFIYPFKELKPINQTSFSVTLHEYLHFSRRLQDLLTSRIIPITDIHDIKKTLLFLNCMCDDFRILINKFGKKEYYETLILNYLALQTSATKNVIHGSLWSENIYTLDNRILIIDFDNICLGDIYYDYASLGLMHYSFGNNIRDIISTFHTLIPGFDMNRLMLSAAFLAIKPVQYTKKGRRPYSLSELQIGLDFFTGITNLNKGL